ncbi:hypothetical protein [Marinisporobacter balticus]|uniref:Uncharacterized protein n=1 Tax=Marinisporobacter balticus TaxID=2018667 RepID=A0A4R2KY94_9FIRM|nr:hypothetical protein [Marinisporobacter balticus]TCO75248.1 hypothetical protein EV214_10985 [Marinisporobacter balticus]
MQNPSKIMDFIIQKKFKEILHATRQGKLYNFKDELKKELETILSKLNNLDHKKEIVALLQEINNQQSIKDWMN